MMPYICLGVMAVCYFAVLILVIKKRRLERELRELETPLESMVQAVRRAMKDTAEERSER